MFTPADARPASASVPCAFILLKWDPAGNLVKVTPIERIDWFNNETQTKLFSTTSPSQYGKAALLLNSDILQFVNFDIQPPLPLMLYTIPNKQMNDPNYIVIPNVYDRSGFNDWVVYDVQQHLRNTNPTFEQYTDNRTNTIVWRGTTHADMDLFRNKLFEISDAQPTNKHKWLDATDTKKRPETQLSVIEMVRNYKYQLDVGGVSGTAWGGLRWKMCSGSITFKVDTWSQDWWHSNLKPYVHYIPVAEDFSNLYEQYVWAEQHPTEAYQIAKAGQIECQKSIKREQSELRQIEITNSLPVATSPEILHYVDEIFDQYLDRFFVHDVEKE